MKPKQFDFIRAETLDEALEGLAEYGAEARILAGGQSQVAMLNFRLIEATVLIDINRLDELDYIRNDNGAVEVGAAARQEDLLEWPQLAATVPLLAAAIPNVGHFQTRNRGTVCGSIAHSDPVSELSLVLATTDGEVVLQSKRRRRVVKAAEFQIGLLSTSREPDEMVVAVRFPHGVKGTGYAFDELSRRKGDLVDVRSSGAAKTRIVAHVPSRGLIGYHGELLTDTRGTGVLNRVFHEWAPWRGAVPGRRAGVLVSIADGDSVAYALFNLEDRGRVFVGAGEKVYKGMIIGEHSRENDLEVNPLKGKKLTNIRAAGKDDAVRLTTPRRLTLEQALAYIADDELVEVTPASIRLRKKILSESERKRASRASA